MPTISHEWGRCIRSLLKHHGLTLRGAVKKSGGVVSHTSIMEWCDGIVPHDAVKAVAFLSAFPREEAIECLRAGGLPIPPEWEPGSEDEQIIVQAFRAASPQKKEHIVAVVKEIIAEDEANDPED